MSRRHSSSDRDRPAPQGGGWAAVIVAAGRGLRAGGDTPKQYRRLAGRPVLAWTLDGLALPEIDRLQVVIHPDDRPLYDHMLSGLPDETRRRLAPPVAGGDSRQASVRAGLAALARPAPPAIVLVHDAARPFATPELIRAVARAAEQCGAAAPALPLTDTVKQVDETGQIVATPDRRSLKTVQTPQAFDYHLLNSVHESALLAGLDDFTDDTSILEWAGSKVTTTPGDRDNMKITEPADFARGEALLGAVLADVRVGQGYDVHAFAPGDHVWLGGLRIPHEAALSGHSDADVALHALTDAVLGAIGEGDIGQHFPPSDPRWKGAASDRFLADAVARVARRGGVVAHLDLTIVCEAPKIGPHREAMRARIAAIAGLEVDRVGVKATTSEGLGFTGRREGVAALAAATIRLPARAS